MAKKSNRKNQTVTQSSALSSFINSKWIYLIIFIGVLLAAVIYYMPTLNGSSLSAHDYQQGTYNAHQLVENHSMTGAYAKWAPNIFSGMPSYQVWFSSNTLSSWITQFLGGIFNPYILISVLIAASAIILFLILNVHPFIALFGSMALLFSNFTIVSLMAGHNNKVMVMSLVPMTLAGIWALYENKKYLLGLFVISLSVALQIRLNHFQITYFMMFLVGVWSVAKTVAWIKEKDFKHLVLSFIIVTLGIGLGAVNNSTQLISTKQYAKETQRGGSSEVEQSKKPESASHEGVGYEYATAWSYGVLESFTLFIPNFSGGPELISEVSDNNPLLKVLQSNGIPYNNALQLTKQLPTYWGNQPFVAGTTYIGAILIFLMVMGFFFIKDEKRWWLIAGFFITLFVAWGDNFSTFYKLLFNHLPFFNNFRTPSMIFYLTTIIAVISGALFLNILVRDGKSREAYWKKVVYVSGGFLAAMLILTVLGPSIFSFTSPADENLRVQLLQMTQDNKIFADAIYNGLLQERKYMMRLDAFRSTIFIALTIGLILLYLKRKLTAEIMLIGIVALTLIDQVGVDKRYVNHESFKDNISAGINTVTPTEADKFILQDNAQRQRVLDLTVSTFNDGKPSYFHKNIGGYHPAKLKRYQDIISYQINPNLEQFREGNPDGAHVLNMLNTGYIITSPNANGVFKNRSAYGDAWLVNEVKVLSGPIEVFDRLMTENLKSTALLEVPSGELTSVKEFQTDSFSYIRLIASSNDEMKYEYSSDYPSYAVFSEIYYNHEKGWNAFIDGEEVGHDQANYILRGLSLPAGKHEIVFKFDAPVLRITAKLDLFSSLLIILIGIGFVVISFKGNTREEKSLA